MIVSNEKFALLTILFSYLLGSIPSGYLAGVWLADIDLRQIGSGSTGATNVLRHVGKIPAVLVFLADVSKGIIPILIAKAWLLNESWQVAIGIMAIIGHIWPIWLRWKGGKAVATGLGMFLGLSWPVGLACLGIFISIISLSKIVSLSSICAAISLPILMTLSFQLTGFKLPYLIISLVSMTMVLWRHRTNIRRLIKGNEPKIGQPH